MKCDNRQLNTYLIPLIVCFLTGLALQSTGLSNGMLMGCFLSALALSLSYPGMNETPGGIILMQIIIGFSVGASLKDHINWEPELLLPLVFATLIALVLQWAVA